MDQYADRDTLNPGTCGIRVPQAVLFSESHSLELWIVQAFRLTPQGGSSSHKT